MKHLSVLLALAALGASITTARAQAVPASPTTALSAETHCLLLPIDAAARAAHVPLIVEAEVLDAEGFRASNGRIYTRHRLRVYKLLKGTAPAELVLLTEGGTVGLDQQQLTNTLTVVPGEQGIFFLEDAAFPGVPAGAGFQAYASQQGLVRYNLAAGTATEPFRRYEQLGTALYQATAATATPRELQPNAALAAAMRRLAAPVVAVKGQAPVISTLVPLSLTAGTGSVLTISGSGFGAARGNGFVEFRNADDGGSTYTKIADDDYVSWTDTRVQVRVPSFSASRNPAGTGPVRLTTTDQLLAQSASVVTIVFAASNVQDSRTGQRAVPAHRNLNGSGGLTFRFDPGFAGNTPANAAWQRALATWRCQTGINWEVGAPRTNRGVADDGENAVGFDNGAELPAGVLGRTTSYYRGCYLPDGRVSFYVQEVDMQYDDATAWQFGPANPAVGQVDFESVAVHELGHAQQLSHLILPSAIMHYAIARGQRSRTLATISDVAGGRYVTRGASFRESSCGPTPMLPAPLTGQSAELAAGTGITLQWTTRAECLLTEFVVERAPVDTTAGWQQVGRVAAGATSGQYRFTDTQPRGGLSFYRLRLRRPDGSLDTAVPLAATNDASAANSLQLFPNPISSGNEPLSLQYVGNAAAGTLTVRFYDMLGRYLSGVLLDYRPGVNLLRVTPPPLRAGIYLVRWTDSNGRKGTTRLLSL